MLYSWLLSWLLVVSVLCLVYAFTVYWLVFWRGPWATAYNPLVAWVLRRMRQQAITIGARTYLSLPNVGLSDAGEKHERFHFTDQWKRWPLTFVPRYLYQLMRYGYDRMPLENTARAAAGEPTR